MKRSTLNGTAPVPSEAIESLAKNNGKSKSHDESPDLNVILAALLGWHHSRTPEEKREDRDQSGAVAGRAAASRPRP